MNGGAVSHPGFTPPRSAEDVTRDPPFLGTAIADRGEQRQARALAVLLVATFVAAAPWAAREMRVVPAFVPAFDAAVLALNSVTGLLLLGQYRQSGERCFLALACGYFFTTALIIAHASSFPDALGPGTLIGGPQTAAWLWMGWHALFPFFVMWYAREAQRERTGNAPRREGAHTARAAVAATLLAAIVVIAIAGLGEPLLPMLVADDRFRSPAQLVRAVGWIAHVVALATVVRATRLHRTIDLWIAVTLVALLIEVALSGVLITGRYQLGFYVGRLYGLLGSLFVLAVLLREAMALHGNAVAATARLRESEDRYRLAMDAMQGSIYEFDPASRHVLRNERMLELIGEPKDTFPPTVEAWLERIHPDDLARFNAALADVYELGKPRFDVEYRVRRANGAYRWVWQRSIAVRDAQGRLVRVIGSVLDVTARREAEEALRGYEEALQRSQARLRATVESVTDYAIFTLDTKGCIDTWNIGAQRLFGFTEHEAIGQSADVIFTPEDRQAGVPQYERWLAREQGRAADERWHLRKDGSRFYVSGVLTPLLENGEITGFAKVARDLTQQQETDAMLREGHQLLEQHVAERTAELAEANESLRQEIVERQLAEASRRKLLRQLVNAQEQERRRISRELHDQLGQQVSVLGLKLAMLRQSTQGDDATRHELEQLAKVVKELDADVDFLVWELRPTTLDDLGLVSALSDYVATWSTHFDVHASLDASDVENVRLAPEIETVLYRIVQEALTNVAKHAGATRADVVLQRDEDTLVLTISDDGVGFDVSQNEGAEARGVGLMSLAERAGLVGGLAKVESTPGKGTTVSVRIPARLSVAREHALRLNRMQTDQ